MSSRDCCAHWWGHCRCRTTRRKGTVDHRSAPIQHRRSSTRPTWRPTLWYHRRRPAIKQKKEKREPTLKIYGTCNIARWLSSTEFSTNPLVTILVSLKYFLLRDEISIFPWKLDKKKLFETRAGQSGFLLARESRPRGLRLRCNLHANQTRSKDLPQVFSRNKELTKVPFGISVYLKRCGREFRIVIKFF